VLAIAKGRAWMLDKDDEKRDRDEDSTPKEEQQEHSAESERMDYDNLWKLVLTRFFWDGLKIFLPKLYEAADRSRDPEFLDKELQKATFDLSGGANRTDLLTRIFLMNGESERALCHTEFQQGKGDEDLPTRMYKYKEAIHLIHGWEPIGIAVTMAPRPKGEKSFYHSEQFGVESLYKYIHVPVLELEDEALLAEENRVGFILYAAKAAWQSGKDEAQKFVYLRKISELWAERHWDPEDKRITLLAVEYLVHLENEDYIKQFTAHMKSLVKNLTEGEKEMYVSAFERVYKQEGREEGREEERRDLIHNMIDEGLSIDNIAKYTRLPREEVEKRLN
jgi:hypothetical protein